MPLEAATKLGPYEVISPLGAGGMGEVYRSRDTRLDRVVAIKILPAHLADRVDLRERFEREARAVSSLNHPNICTLFDVGEQNGIHFLVMEYVEGETLAQRLQRGPLPLEQTLRYATEIADALDKAHRQGVVHRDLKPGNIMLTKSGSKLLDFGLARLRQPAPSPAFSSASMIPTDASGLTVQGTILGTLQYMAPEQLEGREADARTDIFAFGAVLYEMVSGKKAFEGKSQVSLMGAILEREPTPVTTLQPGIPQAIDRVIRKCLAKDPDDRWQTASDLRSELRWVSTAPAVPQPSAKPSRGWMAVAAATTIISIALAVALFVVTRSPAETESIRFSISPPDRTTLENGVQPNIGGTAGALSPDGRRLAFTARDMSGKLLLWVRPLDSLTAQSFAGTDGAGWPFWSPDSKWIGFFAQGKLKKIDISGGPPQVLADAPNGRGGAWNRDGVIVFAPGNPSPLSRVSAAGGEAVVLTKLLEGQTGHRLPEFLPDGNHFIYFSLGSPETSAVYVSTLDDPEPRLLLRSDSAALYSPPGYLLFIRQGTLLAQAFDAAKLEFSGDPVRVAEEVLYAAGSRGFTVSHNGALAYRTGAIELNLQLAWYDRNGKLIETVAGPGPYRGIDLSPDGKRIVVHRHESAAAGDIWLIESARGPVSRLTFDTTQESISPVWSPDGKTIAFASLRNAKWGIFIKPADGSGTEEMLFESNLQTVTAGWSPDGKFVVYMTLDPKTRSDVWTVPVSGDRKPVPILQTPFTEADAQISPDGKWIAYQSDETGRPEVYIRPFPSGGGKWQISTNSGAIPRWRRDGNELFYGILAGNETKVAAIEIRATGSSIEYGTARDLFNAGIALIPHGTGYSPYAVSADGQRFLVTRPEGSASGGSPATPPLTVVINWQTILTR